MGNRLYVDVHVLQTVPPSCLNRDDTGSPKTAIYGGVQRARVSSQSWKRAIREMFKEEFDESQLGIRTKKIVDLVARGIVEQNPSISWEDALKKAEDAINTAGVTTKDGEAKALFFMGSQQAKNIAKLILSNETFSKKEVQAVLKKGNSIDTALFGRMVADDPSLNTDASAQVAHAISTHSVDIEYDYFTAVDDCAPEDNAGAGMIGTVEFDSATLYRYATVAAHELYKQLAQDKGATSEAIKEFVHAFVTSMPAGKQNTFANRTPADAVLICLRTDQPINLVGAFESPVKEQSGGFVAPSIVRLNEYAAEVYSTFVAIPQKSWIIGKGLDPDLGEATDLAQAIDELGVLLKSSFDADTSEDRAVDK